MTIIQIFLVSCQVVELVLLGKNSQHTDSLFLFNFQATSSVKDVENQSNCVTLHGSSDNGEKIEEIPLPSTINNGEFFVHSPLYS